MADQQDGKVLNSTSSDDLNAFNSLSQGMSLAGPGDFLYSQIMQTFYETYCGCTLNQLMQTLFMPVAMAPAIEKPYHSAEAIDCSKLQGTIYENFVIYSKNDINLQLLQNFKYETETRRTPTGRPQTVYICGHDDCKKEFLRTCNLLDHMRMHEGIKPNTCEYCGKGFTQKSNLRKHLKVHIAPELESRKRYTCEACGCKYTERYNYKVSDRNLDSFPIQGFAR